MTTPTVAISVRQPWAWAIIHAGKNIENRHGASPAVKHITSLPFSVAIHASRGMTQVEYESARRFIESLGVNCPRPDELPRGAIIGTATICEIVRKSESPWFFGPTGLVIENPLPLDPIPAAGQLGLFRWTQGGTLAPVNPWMKAWHGKSTSKTGDLFT